MDITKVCLVCGQEFTAKDCRYKYCSDECRKQARRQKDVEHKMYNEKWNREHGRCIKCGKQDAMTINGHCYCGDCREKRAEMSCKYRAKHPDKFKVYRENRKAQIEIQHLCKSCGRKLPDDYKYKQCGVCLAKSRIYNENKRRQKGIMPRGLFDGICTTCNKRPAIAGKKLCRECYDKAVKNITATQPDTRNHICRVYDNSLFLK